MKPHSIDPAGLGQQALPDVDSEARKSRGLPVVPEDEVDLDELLAYHSVPPRRTVTLTMRCKAGGRMRPLPYPLENAAGE